MMKNRSAWIWVISIIFILIISGLLSIEEFRMYVVTLFLSSIAFVKKNIIAILTAFFLIKGKFVLRLFMKKIILLSASGLGKRYMIERVLTYNFKIHFLDHLNDDFKRLTQHIKKNFNRFPLIKKITALSAFIGSLGFVGKFMGSMLVVKVFIAKIWSFLLAIFLKVSTSIIYFFTDYLWGSWIAPIIEIVVFSWLVSWMEKIPFLNKILHKIYFFFFYMFGWMNNYIEKRLHIPLKRILKWMVKKIRLAIYKFIGYERVSLLERLREVRALSPNSHTLLMKKRENRKIKKSYISIRDRLNEKRTIMSS